MFAMSVKLACGESVTIEPRLIGVPLAATPGLVPHDDVATAVELADAAALLVVALLVVALVGALLELELELLHPARTPPTARTATAAPASRECRSGNLSMWSAFSG
jgi:hypothetical protein